MLDSIRTQLALWFTCVLALVLILFAIATYLFLRYSIQIQTDNTLQEIARTFIAGIEREQIDLDGRTSTPDAAITGAIQEAMGDLKFRSYQILVFDARGKLLAAGDQMPDETNPSEAQLTKVAADFSVSPSDSVFLTLPVKETEFRFFAQKKIDGLDFLVLVAHPLNAEDTLLGRFRSMLIVFVVVALVLAMFGGYFLARKSLAPVAQLSDSAAAISATNLNARLPVKNRKDELGGLATVLNLLLGRLENSFEQQKRFMADASHELRTPLAIVLGEAEVALSKADRPNAELRESLGVVFNEGKRLSRIVEDLFTLARVDAGEFRTNFSEIYLDELVSDCVRKVRVLAEKRNVSIEFTAAKEMPMLGDEQLLQRLFINLLDNAIKYNQDGGSVLVNAERSREKYQITITDTGAGIPKSEQAKIFERFYRTDKARSRSAETITSGAGLGLSIATWISEIHRAEIKLISSDDSGSAFSVVFSI